METETQGNPAASTSQESQRLQDTMDVAHILTELCLISHPALSMSSMSDYCATKFHSRKKARPNSIDEEYTGAIDESMRQPITTMEISNTSSSLSDPVDSFVAYLGSLLKSFQNEDLKLDVMNNVSQIVMNAKLEDFRQFKIKLDK